MSNDEFRHALRQAYERVQELSLIEELRCRNGWSFVPNLEWEKFLSPEGPIPHLVVVGDNPGKREWLTSTYFCNDGAAGKIARRFLDLAFGSRNVVEEGYVIICNRSSFHTPATADLYSLMVSSNTDPLLLKAIREDQRKNGRLVAAMALALGIPVLEIGGGELGSKIFVDFRNSCREEATKQSWPAQQAVLSNQPRQCRFHRAPHFSYCAAFRASGEDGWRERHQNFLEAFPWARTAKGNVSWKQIRQRECQKAARAYLLEVMLG